MWLIAIQKYLRILRTLPDVLATVYTQVELPHLIPRYIATVYTEVELPPLERRETRKSSSLPNTYGEG